MRQRMATLTAFRLNAGYRDVCPGPSSRAEIFHRSWNIYLKSASVAVDLRTGEARPANVVGEKIR
jgi:hypothetical protein